MKRSWIGFILLLVLLLGGILSTRKMVAIHEPIEEHLLLAAQCAMLGDWENTRVFFRKAEENWKKWEHFRNCFADHNPVEEIDASFSALKVYYAFQETLPFTGGCCQLARQVAAVGEAHQLVWWNLL